LKILVRILTLLVFAGLLGVPAGRVHAQAAAGAAQPAAHKGGGEHMDEPESNAELEQYRHSGVVIGIAHLLHVKTETAAEIFEDLNSGFLLFAIGWVLWKMLPKMFRKRSETLQEELVGARLATEDANRRLAEVEARLLRLDSEIDAVRGQVELEAAEDEKRIHAALETERERIVASAETEIAAAQAAAQRDLKRFAADLAIDNAMRKVQLSDDTDRALIREFGKSLNKKTGGEA